MTATARLTPSERVEPAERSTASRVLRAVGRRVGVFVAVSAIIIIAWWAFLAIAGISPFVGKTPLVVWDYLVAGPDAAANRAAVGEGLAVTAHDALIGYVAGLGGASIVAILFALLPAASTTFLPVAMVLRTFPLVALTPLIILAFGRGDSGLAAIGFIVVFFAALVTISFGIASAPREALDVVTVFGGGRWARVMKVGVPYALPAFFTAARIAIPQALSAALIAEWLITGTGSGSQLMRAAGTSQYDTLWAVAVVLVAVATVVYTIVSAIEEIVLGRFRDAA
jgi:ABC-type nitrate/sulfonate/bicarbonate transport system permease component